MKVESQKSKVENNLYVESFVWFAGKIREIKENVLIQFSDCKRILALTKSSCNHENYIILHHMGSRKFASLGLNRTTKGRLHALKNAFNKKKI